MRNVRCRVLLLMLAGAVAGCAHSGKTDKSAAQPTPAVEAVAAAPVAAAPPHKKPHPTPAVVATAKPQIDELIGWNESEIRTVFGAPAAQEDHAPTRRLVYHDRQCTMDVTLYPEVETRQFQALNYEVNADDGSAKRQQACVAEFSARLPAKPLAK
jgi:hypothetical protein